MVALKAAELAVAQAEVIETAPVAAAEPAVAAIVESVAVDSSVEQSPGGGRQRQVPGQLGPTLLKH